MKKIYRVLSLLLVFCMLTSFASAAGITEEEHTHESGIVETSLEETVSSGIQEISSDEDTAVSAEETTGIVSTDTGAVEEAVSTGIVSTEPEENAEETTISDDTQTEAVSSTPAAEPVQTTPVNPEVPAAEKQDRMTWTLDENGTLVIGGKGIVIAIDSAENQPWAEVREQIKEVHFDENCKLLIEDIAHWFDGCVNLTYAEIPAYAFAIGDHAFRNCNALSELALFHSQAIDISLTAFEAAGASDICVYVRNEDAYDSASKAAWYGRSIEVIDLTEYPVSTYSGYCMAGCTCSECTWSWIIDQYDEDYHYKYAACDDCSGNEYAYGTKIAHTFSSSGICTVCGYEQTYTSCSHGSTYNQWSGCTYYTYCYYCDEYLGSGVEHGTYTYGSWSYYSSSQHRRSYACSDCGEGDYQYGYHSTTTQYTNYSDTQHSVASYCATCSATIGSTSYASHSYSYGTWSSFSSSQHRRTKACSLCGLSTYEYGNHADSNSDGTCDTCSYVMTFTVTWNASSNGGTVNGANTVTTTVTNGAVATAPSYTPAKTGHTFKGWYTTSTGSALYDTVTVTAARTFYAHFTAASYTVTFDPGEGSTATTTKSVTYGGTYGELPVPTRGGYNFDGWFTEETGGTQITADTTVEITASTTLYAQWTRLVSFSVTVPAVLPLVVDENGEVYSTTASIINNSTGGVNVASVSLSGQNGWSIAPFGMNAAQQKVDSKQIGFSIRDAQTVSSGSSETLAMPSLWHIAEGDTLDLAYDAVVSALSQPVSEVSVLSAIFVLEWAPV